MATYNSNPTLTMTFVGDKTHNVSVPNVKAQPVASDITNAAAFFSENFDGDSNATFVQAFYTTDSVVARAS